MLIHEDVDDEQTLAEAEAEQSVGEVQEEVADLQQVLYSLLCCVIMSRVSVIIMLILWYKWYAQC